MNQKYNLILGSGGIKGFALVGAIKAIEDAEIPVTKVAGVSVGSIVGAFYTNGYDFKSIRDWFLKLDLVSELSRNIFTVIYDSVKNGHIMPFFEARPFVRRMLNKEVLGFTDNFYVVVANRTKRITEKYNYTLAENNPEGRMSFEDLISASMSIPAVFTPVFINGQRYCDGGTYKGNCPVDIFSDEESEDVTNIAIQISKPSVNPNTVGVFNDFLDTFEGTQWELYKEQIADSKKEILIEPDCGNLLATDFNISSEEKYRLMRSGYDATIKVFKENKII